jgi:exodeoxyribonuclease VII small subunit
VAEKKTPVSKLSFSEAMAEVEGIVARLENEQTDVDELAGEVKRALELITACRGRLEKTDREVRELVSELEPDADPDPDPGA